MRQASKRIMMVRPKHFGYDPETAESNAFQSSEGAQKYDEIERLAIGEFDAAVEKLRHKGVEVEVIEDTDSPKKLNAVFPNNWVSFHDDKVVLYPMLTASRRSERRLDVVEQFQDQGFVADEVIDLSNYESEDKFLESTGSIIFDYEHKLAYACISPRTDAQLFEKLCEITGFEPIAFYSYDEHGQEIYHTNVMMCIASDYVVICSESIPEDQRTEVLGALTKTGHEIVDISLAQVHQFAGNMLELEDKNGQSILVMSKAAFLSLTKTQVDIISKYSELLAIPIPTIEKYGGGSIRCMMCRVN